MEERRSWSRISLPLAAVLLCGCVGRIEDTASSEGPQGTGVADPTVEPGSGECRGFDLGFSGLARLTAPEYRNTVRDLLGDAIELPAVADLPPDERAGPFQSNVPASIEVRGAEAYWFVADDLAHQAAASLDGLLPCEAAGPEDLDCAERFIRELTRDAYRRPPTDEQVESLLGVFQSGVDAHGTFEDGIRIVLLAVLQSPHFLYRIERGVTAEDGADVVALDDYEVASRLSYFLWQTMPDEELAAAADAGELTTPEGLAAHAERMLADPRADRAIHAFFGNWLDLTELDDLERDAELFPEYDPALAPQMRREAEAFVSHVLREGDGSFTTLLTAPFTMAEPELAEMIYGLEPSAGAAPGEPARLELDPEQRAGLLTQPGVLAVHSHPNQTSPVHRGKLVRERFFCQSLPPPPPDVDDTAPPVDPELPTRERFRAHSENEACVGCHRLVDPIGFGFEQYDAIGRWRDRDGDHAVDASGEIFEADVAGSFDGAVELANRLAESRQAQTCFAEQWVTFALGRNRTDRDLCSFDAIMKEFLDSGLDVRALMLAITKTDAFRHRRVTELEGE